MADELLNAQDLITAKKHDTFHSEVVTGKAGGLSTGANIDYATNAVTGQVQKTLPATVNGIDWTYVGKFADGVTFTKKTDFALDGDGTQWIYVGSDQFPKTVPPATVPSEPDYQVVHVSDHNSTTNRNAVGAHDEIYSRTFNSVSDLKLETEIADGITVKTSGYNSVGDGGGNYYIVKSITQHRLDINDQSWVPDGGRDFYIGGGTTYVAVSKNPVVTLLQCGWIGGKYGPKAAHDLILAGVTFEVPAILSSFSDAFAQWVAGNKYPLAFFGDSTTDGAGSTTDGTNEATVFNADFLVGGEVPDGFNRDHGEVDVPNAYPSILQRMVREYTKNNILRFYNAGYRGQRLYNGWAQNNIYNAIYANASYSDAKMVGICFGLNDSNETDLNELVARTETRTRALILDAYARGIQPFLMSCTMSGRAGAVSYNTQEIDKTIDNVKRRLCREYGIEFLELSEFFTDYISKNGDFVSYQDLTFDDLHPSDLGYLKLSEFMVKTFAGGVSIPDITDAIGIDYTTPAMRLSGIAYNKISSVTTVARGVSQRLRNITESDAGLAALAGSSFVDAWVWNESPDAVLVYSNYTDQASDGSALTSLSNAIQIECESRRFIVGTPSNLFTMPDPDAYGSNFASTYRIETPVKMRRLEYGLNYIRIRVPSSLESGYLAPSNFFGAFYFRKIKDHISVVSLDQFNTSMPKFINDRQFIDAVTNKMYPALPVATRVPEPDAVDNFAGVPNVGDRVEFLIDADLIGGAGVIIGYNWYDTLNATGLDKNKYRAMGDSWYLANVAGNMRIESRPPTGSIALSLDFGVAYPTDKAVVIRVERESSASIRFTALDLLGSTLATVATSDSKTLKSFSGLIVGGFVATTGGTASTLRVNAIKLREYR